MPISNLCNSTNLKYEEVRGVGENVLEKTARKRTTGEELGLLRNIRLFPLILCNIPLLLIWFNPFNT